MADILAANVTVTINERHYLGRAGYLTEATVAFGDGALTYGSGGIPVTAAKFGFKQVIRSMQISDNGVSGHKFEFNPATNKIRMLGQSVTMGATAAAANENGALVVNSAGTEQTAPRFPKTVASTTYPLGKMAEIGQIAFAAVSLRIEARGW